MASNRFIDSDDAKPLMMPEDSYINWDGPLGSGGFGIRSNSGQIEAKNADGDWSEVNLFSRTGTTVSPAHAGDAIELNDDNSQALKICQLSELTTIKAAATTDTTIQIPAGSIVLGVSGVVQTVIPTAATFSVIGATSSTEFEAEVSTTVSTTWVGMTNCPYLNTAAQKIRFTPNESPGAATGKVRVVVNYIQITPPED